MCNLLVQKHYDLKYNACFTCLLQYVFEHVDFNNLFLLNFFMCTPYICVLLAVILSYCQRVMIYFSLFSHFRRKQYRHPHQVDMFVRFNLREVVCNVSSAG